MPFQYSTTLAVATALLLAGPVIAQNTTEATKQAEQTSPAPTPDQDPAAAALPDIDAIVKAYQAGDYVTARAGLARLAPEGTANTKYRYGRILFEGRGGPRDLTEAARWLSMAAEENHVAAATLLARMYMQGAGVDKNPQRAVNLLERAATRGDAAAQFMLGANLRNGIGVARNDATAFNWFLAAAEQQHIEAQFAVSQAYAQGLGIEKSPARALDWLERAASNGLPAAQFYYAVNLEAGTGGQTPNPSQALAWYRRAAEGGNRDAQRILGTKYLQGDGVEQNSDEAMRWLATAAEAGDAGAMSNLGYAYATGTGVAPDDAKARDWYQRASDRGLPRSMMVLATFYETGRGGPQDLRQAVTYYKKALDRGISTAAIRLGLMAARGVIDDLVAPQDAAVWVGAAAREETGDETGADIALIWLEAQAANGVQQAQGQLAGVYLTRDGRAAEAVALFQQAARGGDTFAQYRLGQIYAQGTGAEQDYVLAHKWFNVAATHGLTNAADMREVISKLMTPEQIAEAQTQARTFFEQDAARVPGGTQDQEAGQ